jgi:Zn-dependent protease
MPSSAIRTETAPETAADPSTPAPQPVAPSTLSPQIASSSAPDPRPARRGVWKIISGAFVTIGVVLLKLKAVIFLLLAKFKLLLVNPFEGFGAMQFAVAAVSMVVTIAAYAVKMPFGFVLGFVLITVIHELGHALIIRAKGLRTGMMVFIPFVGGAVTLKDQPHSAYVDAQIGLAGPIAGTLACLVSLQIFKWSDKPLFLAIAFAGFLINLLNLLPVGPLDGGRISGAVSKWMWLFGGAILVYKTVRQHNPLLVLILILSAFQVYNSIVHEKESDFYALTAAQRITIALAYFAIVVFLGHQAMMTYDRLQALRV